MNWGWQDCGLKENLRSLWNTGGPVPTFVSLYEKSKFFQGRAKGKVSCLWHTGASRTQPWVGRFLCDVEYWIDNNHNNQIFTRF